MMLIAGIFMLFVKGSILVIALGCVLVFAGRTADWAQKVNSGQQHVVASSEFNSSEWSQNINKNQPSALTTPQVATNDTPEPDVVIATPQPSIEETLPPTPVVATTLETQPTLAAPKAEYQISSPLPNMVLGDLNSIITSPFEMPKLGEDSGHHGVDFGFWVHGDQKSMIGLPILSILPGTVAATITTTDPYGNMILIETPLKDIAPNLLSKFKLPTHAATTPLNTRLGCSPVKPLDSWNETDKSLYILYAHMNKPSSLAIGSPVQTGEQIGEVGNTGMSSGPHLHLEMRIGPGDVRFTRMGHYARTTTTEERQNYCTWRVSGIFDLFNPLDFFAAYLQYVRSPDS